MIQILLLTLTLVQASTPSPVVNNALTPLTFWVQVGAISGAIVGILTFALVQAWPRIQTRLDRRSLQKRIGAQSYTPDGIERSLRYFIAPMCQDIDPSGEEEPRMVYGVKQKLYDALDDALANPTTYKYLILLADSGMGKTTALLNYYAKHLRKWLKPKYKVALVPLSNPNADDQIQAIEDQPNTVLLLDALDEDTLAMVDYKERLRLLLKATAAFRTVVMSCRTQFFSKDEEIPKQTGIIKVSARAAGEEAEYCFQKIYLSPFSDTQVNKYIRRRYPFWRKEQRRRAKQMVLKIPHLTARPMLLAHVDDLIKTRQEYHFASELYEAMVKAWIERERGFIDADALNQFSERLAVDIYINRFTRKAERIQKSELTDLAKDWGIPLEDWKLTGRSLLNRDAEGNFKFAHRSIMEYLFVKRFMAGDSKCANVEWTDQMKSFLWEMLQQHVNETGVVPSVFQSLLYKDETLDLLREVFADHLSDIGSYVQSDKRFHTLRPNPPFELTNSTLLTPLTLLALLAFIVNPNSVGTIVIEFAAVNFGSDGPRTYEPIMYVRQSEASHLGDVYFGKFPGSYQNDNDLRLNIIPPDFAPVGLIGLDGDAENLKLWESSLDSVRSVISSASWNKRYLAEYERRLGTLS